MRRVVIDLPDTLGDAVSVTAVGSGERGGLRYGTNVALFAISTHEANYVKLDPLGRVDVKELRDYSALEDDGK